MIETFLTEEEFTYLQSLLSSMLKTKLVENLVKVGHIYALKIDESFASNIREACGDQLVFEGLDEKYEPNEKGQVPHILIGKLFDRI